MPARSKARLREGGVGLLAAGQAQLQAVAGLEQVGGELVDRKAVGGLDVALGTLAHVVRLGDRAQVVFAPAAGAAFELGQLAAEALELGLGVRGGGVVARGRGSRIGHGAGVLVVGNGTPGQPCAGRSAGDAAQYWAQRREFKASPSRRAVTSTIGMTRS
jgi:hypothetical protein